MSFSKRLLSSAPAAFVASENFNVVTYTGDGTTSKAITGVGFQPDFIWIKERSGVGSGPIADSTRGTGKAIYSNLTDADYTFTSGEGIKSFDSDGFTVGDISNGNAGYNGNGDTYVAWCWKANGGTTSSNTNGSITSTVQTNTDAGFSIVKYTGNGSSSATVGHNLGAIPDLTIFKQLDSGGTSGGYWNTYLTSNNTVAFLNVDTAFVSNNGGTNGSVDISNMSSTTFGFLNGSSSANNQNNSGTDYIVYCFKSIDNFSKIGTYTGNGSADGPIVETGFEPAFLIVKGSSNTGSWLIFDNKRNTTNPRNKVVRADSNAAETTSSTIEVDFLSNGFQLTGTDTDYNGSSRTYIYMAFAADPDTESPTLASSFNAFPFVGSGDDPLAINKVGFKPGLVWMKSRDVAREFILSDIVRGPDKEISTNDSAAEESRGVSSFNADGFTLDNSTSNYNDDGEDYMLWTWKADDNEPTILPNTELSTLISKYKFENNANDSYADNNGTASNLSYVSGKFGKAADFNGSSSKILYPQAAPFNDSNTILAISAWVKLDSASDEFVLMSASSTSDQSDYGLLIAGGNRPGRVFLSDAPSNANEYQGTFGSGNDTNWNHYVWQLSASGGIELWYNGTKQTRTTLVSSGSMDETKWFGDLTYATSVQWATGINRVVTTAYSNGSIDQIRLFNAELTSSEISDLYNEGLEALVSANANAGFSIVKYEGNGVSGTKVPHGLSSTPELIITKNLEESRDWRVFHTDLSTNQFLALNTSGAVGTAPTNTCCGAVASVDATTFGFVAGGTSSTEFDNVNKSGIDYISYCFHSVSGFSKFGSYTGNGSSSGPSVTTGFKPDFIVIKRTDSTEDWKVIDSIRGFANTLEPNENIAEETGNNSNFTFTSTGFQIGDTHGDFNASSGTYIYWAVAKNVPQTNVLLNSFKTVTYTGNGSVQSITGFGFSPDFLWIKRRSNTENHSLYDSVRGVQKEITSDKDSPNAETTKTNGISSFDSDGFTVAENNANNTNTETYVAWGWKAGGTWVSNLNGSVPSIVNANTANGFSVVKWVGDGNINTIGHGLSSAPEAMFIKNLDSTGDWQIYHSGIGNSNKLILNKSDAASSSTRFNSTSPTSSVFTFRDVGLTGNLIAYCWHSVSGFSKIGSYTGNGSTQSITGLGFQPDWVLLKESSSSESWRIFDSVRGATKRLFPDNNGAESNASDSLTSFDIDGFSLGSSSGVNQNNETYVYYAVRHNLQPQAGFMSFLVVAGGGSGGRGSARSGGGGGAGGLRTSYGGESGGGSSAESDITLAAGTYTITVGDGGAAKSGSDGTGNDGGDSSIAASGLTTITSTGGGGGGYPGSGRDGGSGGGGAHGGGSAGAGTANQGFAGGTGVGESTYNGGGGGGASAAGSNSNTSNGGAGGAGLTVNITGSAVAYAGGGGGGGGGTAGSGGNGGGGAGGTTTGTSGTANTGGGGGGAQGTSGAGGSGVVILRLLTSEYSGTTTGSPTVTTTGDYTIIKYTSSGTYVHS